MYPGIFLSYYENSITSLYLKVAFFEQIPTDQIMLKFT